VLPSHEVAGSGDPLVLIPGTFSDRRTWAKVVGALTPRFRCLLLDPRGTGASADPGRPFGPDDLVDDVLEAMDAAGFERAHLLGHSLGAHVALLLAARHPDRVRRVVAAAPTAHADLHLESVFDLWEALIRSELPDHVVNLGVVLLAFGRDGPERLLAALVREMDAHPIPRATMLRYVECDRRLDLRQALSRLDAPLLVVAGEQDALSGVAQPRSIAEAVPGSRLEVLAACGHSPQLERAAAFARLVAEFLTQ
jgi:3-oxoadipate enol-lactonase